MRLRTAVAIAAIAGSIGFGFQTSESVAQAQPQQPAEIPPASYNGKQYVDSRGCVFIRAGIDGSVLWVPRVTRDRKIVCGFVPSLPTQVAEAPVQPAPAPEPVVTPAPAATPAARPAPQRVATVATTPTPVAVRRAVTPPPPPPEPEIIVLEGRPAAGLSRRSAQSAQSVTGTTRIVPKHVAVNRLNTRNVTVPKGYKPVWTDGRLNPHRAEQTLEGRAQMLQVWTNTVPRRLVNVANGDTATTSVPVIHPSSSIGQSRPALGEVDVVRSDGTKVRRVVRTQSVTRKPTYSSRSAAPNVSQRSENLAGNR